MKNNPTLIDSIIHGATYRLPTYTISDIGLCDGGGMEIKFCKGSNAFSSSLNQEGVLPETIIQAAKQYLESRNVAPMTTREISIAITKLDEAIMWIEKERKIVTSFSY